MILELTLACLFTSPAPLATPTVSSGITLAASAAHSISLASTTTITPTITFCISSLIGGCALAGRFLLRIPSQQVPQRPPQPPTVTNSSNSASSQEAASSSSNPTPPQVPRLTLQSIVPSDWLSQQDSAVKQYVKAAAISPIKPCSLVVLPGSAQQHPDCFTPTRYNKHLMFIKHISQELSQEGIPCHLALRDVFKPSELLPKHLHTTVQPITDFWNDSNNPGVEWRCFERSGCRSIIQAIQLQAHNHERTLLPFEQGKSTVYDCLLIKPDAGFSYHCEQSYRFITERLSQLIFVRPAKLVCVRPNEISVYDCMYSGRITSNRYSSASSQHHFVGYIGIKVKLNEIQDQLESYLPAPDHPQWSNRKGMINMMMTQLQCFTDRLSYSDAQVAHLSAQQQAKLDFKYFLIAGGSVDLGSQNERKISQFLDSIDTSTSHDEPSDNSAHQSFTVLDPEQSRRFPFPFNQKLSEADKSILNGIGSLLSGSSSLGEEYERALISSRYSTVE